MNKRLAVSVKRLVKTIKLSVKCYPLNANNGFTLIEVLMAAAIMGIIGLTILTTFAGGFRVYERLQAYGGEQADALLVLEEIEQNIHNAFPHSSLTFEGNSRSIAIPNVFEVIETVGEEDKVVTSPGRIVYLFDDGAKELKRGQQNYAQATADSPSGDDQLELAAYMDDIQFSYGTYNTEEDTYSWNDAYNKEDENPLIGVKVLLAYHNGSRAVELNRTVLLKSEHVEEAVEEAEDEDDEVGDPEVPEAPEGPEGA